MPRSSVTAPVALFGTTLGLYLAFRDLGQEPFLPGSRAWMDLSEGLLKLALWVVPCAIALRVAGAASFREAWRRLGFTGSVLTGYGFGFVASLPMLAVVVARGRVEFDATSLTSSVLLGPLAEEVLFRGFLFAQLCAVARWPPVAAALASSAAFGLAHLDNTGSFNEVLATGGGGLLLSWVVYRWQSLWPAIGLHVAMNLSWAVVGADRWVAGTGAPALASVSSEVTAARLATVVLAVAITLARTRSRLTNHQPPQSPIEQSPISN
jgi:membrane protease YdiL (CAAX protease family)